MIKKIAAMICGGGLLVASSCLSVEPQVLITQGDSVVCSLGSINVGPGHINYCVTFNAEFDTAQ